MGQMLDTPQLLPGVLDQFKRWDDLGYNIVIFTGRRESMREITEQQLKGLGLAYDQLVMGVGGGKRVLINDKKANGEETAFAINVDRNKGMIDIPEF